MFHQFPWHYRNISCTWIMVIFIKSVCVHKMSIFHTEFLRLFIHHIHKRTFTACKMFCHCHTTVIRTCNRNTFQHIIYSKLFSCFQKHCTSAVTHCIFTYSDHIVKAYLSTVNSLHYKEHSHNFCNACNR